MIEGLNNIYNRINQLKKSGKFIYDSIKPEFVKNFQDMLNNSINSSKTKTINENFHPLSQNNKIDIYENDNNDNDRKTLIDKTISKASKKFNVSEDLIRSVIKVESNYNQFDVSKAGAMGLMQLMPKTALELGVERPFDIEENIFGGTKYLRMMLDRYNGDLDKALAAYNAGPNRVDEANGIPDIEETKNYVKLVKKYYFDKLGK